MMHPTIVGNIEKTCWMLSIFFQDAHLGQTIDMNELLHRLQEIFVELSCRKYIYNKKFISPQVIFQFPPQRFGRNRNRTCGEINVLLYVYIYIYIYIYSKTFIYIILYNDYT